MRKSREKENKSLLRVQDYTNHKRKLKTKAIPDYFPWPTAFMLTGPKKGLSFQANTRKWKDKEYHAANFATFVSKTFVFSPKKMDEFNLKLAQYHINKIFELTKSCI